MCAARGVDCRKKGSQYLGLILRKNSLLLDLECLLSTQSSSKEPSGCQQEHRPWLWNVCFLESVLENCGPTLSANHRLHLATKTNDIYTQLIFQDSASISLLVLCLSEFIITMTSPSSEMKQDSIQGTKFMLLEFEGWESSCKIKQQEFRTRYEGIILQKRFVRELYWRNALWRRIIEYFGI
jgi:hypothetical protein